MALSEFVNEPRHDSLIAELIEERAKLKVVRDFLHPVYHPEHRLWLPSTRIFVFREGPGRYQLARFQPDHSNYPRLRLRVKVLRTHEFWFSAHRIAHVGEVGPTPFEIDHIDRDRWNWNGWNLRAVTHLENVRNQQRFELEMDPSYWEFLEELSGKVRAEHENRGLILPERLRNPDDDITF